MDAAMLAAVRHLRALDPGKLEEQIAGLKKRLQAYECLLTLLQHLGADGTLAALTDALVADDLDLAALGPDLPTTTDLGRAELSEARDSGDPEPEAEPAKAAAEAPKGPLPVAAKVTRSPRTPAKPVAARESPRPPVSRASTVANQPGEYQPEYHPSVDSRDPPERPASKDTLVERQERLRRHRQMQQGLGIDYRKPALAELAGLVIPNRGTPGKGGRQLSEDAKHQVRQILMLLDYAGPTPCWMIAQTLGYKYKWTFLTLQAEPSLFAQDTRHRWLLTAAAKAMCQQL